MGLDVLPTRQVVLTMAKRFGLIGIARVAWKAALIAMLGGKFQLGLADIVPLPWAMLSRTYEGLSWLNALPGYTVYVVGDTLLASLQIYQLWWAFSPSFLPQRQPSAAAAAGGSVNWGSMQRSPWATAAILSASVTVTVVLGAAIIAAQGSRGRATLVDALIGLGWGPWIVAAVLSALGFVGSVRHVGSAKANIGAAFGAKELPATHALTRRVHDYAARMGLPLPAVAYMNEVNAYAAGSTVDDAVVVLGVPLIRNLNSQELDAVICHELGHIVSGDMRRMETADGYQTTVGWAIAAPFKAGGLLKYTGGQYRGLGLLFDAFGNLFRMTFLFVSELFVRRLSRHREFKADAISAALTSPEAMASALRKMENISAKPTDAESQFAYMMFRPPSLGGLFGAAFATHPTIAERVQALESRTHLDKLPRAAGAQS